MVSAEALRSENDRVIDLLSRLDHTDPEEQDQRMTLFREARTLIERHAEADENQVYPVLAEMPGLREAIDASRLENRRIRILLSEVGHLREANGKFHPWAQALLSEFEAHATREARELLPNLSAVLTPAAARPSAAVAMQPMEYAGFWVRLVAFVVDDIILSILSGIAGGVVGGLVAGAGGVGPTVGGWIGLAVVLAVWWIYFAWFECSRYQATPGKKLMRLKVTDAQGKRIGFWRATGRFFGKFVSGVILAIGFFMAAFTHRKQALHDKMAGTLVVHR